MAQTPDIGECHICGNIGKLSFEHVPPESAFNDCGVFRANIFKTIEESIPPNRTRDFKAKKQQRGAGDYTLCEKCNSCTGSWYGPAFIAWAKQGKEIVGDNGLSPLDSKFSIFPLRVIKQVVCMFFSVNSPQWGKKYPKLVRFVLDQEACNLPNGIRLFAFYTSSKRWRRSGVTGKVDLTGGGETSVFSEITFPPFGFVLTTGSPPPVSPLPDTPLCETTYFSDFKYNQKCCDISLKLPTLPTDSYFPGDYRSEEQVAAEAESES
jgi:hypothetical protein